MYMDDDVIDLVPYLKRDGTAGPEGEAKSFFTIWGGEGERSKFALPLWRVVYLASGRRAGLLWSHPNSCAEGTPIFVLDLGAEPARMDFPTLRLPDGVSEDRAPSILDTADGVTIFLGTHADRLWFIVVDERGALQAPLTAETREDLLFSAGECAGLLFHQNLASENGDED